MFAGINQLDDVVEALRLSLFPKARWFPLGLALGLYKTTLDSIESQHGKDISRCLMECLSSWLNKVDKVAEKGGTTWDTLAIALKKIEETVSSDNISEYINIISEISYNVVAGQILQRHSEKLLQASFEIHVLCAEKMITKVTYRRLEILSAAERQSEVLKAIHVEVLKSHVTLKGLVKVLIRSEETISLAKLIIDEYSMY